MPAEITYLFNKYLDGSCSKEEFEELMHLLNDRKHEAAVKEILQYIYENNSLENDLVGVEENDATFFPRLSKTKRTVRWGKISLVAAAVAVMVLIISFLIWSSPKGNSLSKQHSKTATYKRKEIKMPGLTLAQTKRGEQKHIKLPDGSEVWLNAESILKCSNNFNKGDRKVFLSGEAFFDVTHNDAIPFIINTGKGVITKVLGTSFDIKAYDSQPFHLSVKRGRVQVSRAAKVLATLEKGKQIKIESDTLTIKDQIQEHTIAAWTDGSWNYDGVAFKEILEDLERIFDVKITNTNSAVDKELITITSTQHETLENILSTICTLTGTKFYTKDSKTYLIK